MNKNGSFSILIMVSCFCMTSLSMASVLHVPAEYPTIQAAIDATVAGDTVLIADGIYSGPGNWNIDFRGKAVTVRSENGPYACIVDCQSIERGFSFRNGETSASVLHGVCIQNAYTDQYSSGSAVRIYNASPTISECHFLDCHSDYTAAALLIDQGSPLITDCMFVNNSCNRGGSINVLDDSDSEIISCLFADNDGAVIYGRSNDASRIQKSVFVGNLRGAIVCENNTMKIGGEAGMGNYFSGNHSGFGADLRGIYGTINARYNHFAGNALSDYYVSPQENFDLSFCQSALVPVTQNVYVSPAGDDSNDGLSWSSPFRSIRYALSVVFPTETNPLTIFIAAGIYSPSASNELFPLPMLSNLTLTGENPAGTVIDAEEFNTVITGWKDRIFNITGLTITGGSYGGVFLSECSDGQVSDMQIVGNLRPDRSFAAGLYVNGESVSIENTTIENNHSPLYIGGASIGGTNVVMMDSIINENSGKRVGGILVSGYAELRNCVISNNTSIEQAGGVAAGDDSIVDQCLITQNDVLPDVFKGLGGGCYLADRATLTNSTISGNKALTGGGIFVARDAIPVIGGTAGSGNYFSSNRAGAGMDLATDPESTVVKNAQYNTFEGIYLSDCFSSPVELFNFTGCVSETTPITQNIFVSPLGNDENDGLTEQTAFRTITHALTSVLADELTPLTVYLDEGVYSASATGENFPLPIVRYVSIEGSGKQLSVLDAENSDRIWIGYFDSDSHVSDLTIRGGYGASMGGGVILDQSDLVFDSCLFTGNRAEDGGAVFCFRASPEFVDCGFNLNEVNNAGGAILFWDESNAIIDRCEFNGNAAFEGAAIAQHGGNSIITRSVFSSNEALRGAAIFILGICQPVIGGSPGNGNTFTNNQGSSGVDLFYISWPPTSIIDARYNIFSGIFLTEHYVAPQANFDLTGCSSESEPVTQDVYVSTDGDDTNDGLSWNDAFLTLYRAMSVVQGTISSPVTIHVAPGIYSPSTTGESFPVCPVSHSIISGMDAASTILDAEGADGVVFIWYANNMVITGLTLTGSDEVGGLTAFYSNGTITDCNIRENRSGYWGGGVHLYYSDFAIHNSIIENNIAGESGGGIQCEGSNNTLAITNSLITGNQGARWTALDGTGCTMTLQNCTISGNHASISGSIIRLNGSAYLTMSNSIVWGNDGIQIDADPSDTSLACCIVEGGWPGSMNADPLFTTGPMGDFYLSQTAAGDPVDSPCLDSGCHQASSACTLSHGEIICMDMLTTRSDSIPDTGTVDLGFHYAPVIPTPTPTPEPTHTPEPTSEPTDTAVPTSTSSPNPTVTPSATATIHPTPTPTDTPEPTPTPAIPDLGVDLNLNASSFQQGDLFLLTASISNPGPEIYRNQPFVVVLDAWQSYYFFPVWSPQFDCDYMDLPVGMTDRELLRFNWPDIEGHADGIIFHAALLSADFRSTIGSFDSVSFGW